MIIATPHDGDHPMSPTGLGVLRQLAIHQLARHMAHPDPHPATLGRLQAQGLVDGDRHALTLTALGWTIVATAAHAGIIGPEGVTP